jgi:hypothetical protein
VNAFTTFISFLTTIQLADFHSSEKTHFCQQKNVADDREHFGEDLFCVKQLWAVVVGAAERKGAIYLLSSSPHGFE